MGEKGSGNPLEVSGEGSQAARGFWTGWVPESMGQGAVAGLRVPRPCFLCAFEVLWPNPECETKATRTHVGPILWS